MANIKISELNPLVTIQDADVLPIVDNAITKKVTAAILRSYTEGNSVLLTGAQTVAGIKTFTAQLASSVATGTAPFSVASTTKVTNLNADLLDGLSSADFATLTGTQTLTNKTLTSPVINEILDSNGNEILGFTPIASATDYITIKNGIGVGVPLHISAAGSSANTGLHLEPKGTGLVQISDGTDATKGIRFRSSGSAASAVTLIDAVSSAGRVITLPNATGTLALTSDLTAYVPTTRTVSTTSPLAGGGALSGDLTLSIPQATTSVNGYLSSTDWTTFNNKQNALTNPITGTGTTSYLPKFTGASALGNSLLQESTVAIGLGVTPITWNAVFKVLQIGTKTAIWDTGGATQLSYNAYNDGANKYLTTGLAMRYFMTDAGHTWSTAPSGTAGGALTFTAAMTLDANGKLGIATTAPSGNLGIGTQTGLITTTGITLGSVNANIEFIGSAFGSGYGAKIYQNGERALSIAGRAGTTVWSDHFTVLDTGNVGIGTITPTFKLDVVGTARVSSNLVVDTDTLFVDATNNRVGIGTATPANKLEVQVATAGTSIIGFFNNTDLTAANKSAIRVRQQTGVSTGFSGYFGMDGNTLFLSNDTTATNHLAISTTGAATFVADATINGVKVGRGAGSIATNTAVGFEAINANVSGSDNTSIGYRTLKANTGSNNTAVGSIALTANTSGNNNTAVGLESLTANTTGAQNTALGQGSSKSMTTGANNTSVGRSSLFSNTTASNNVAVGVTALQLNTAANNTAVGFEAASSNTSAVGITAIGYQALKASTGANNTALGGTALTANTTGTSNTAIGFQALLSNTTGIENTAIGVNSLVFNIIGSYNTAIGRSSLQANTASNNTAVGFEAAKANTTGTGITAIGHLSLTANTTGNNNTALGFGTVSGNFSGSLILGKDATATANNQFVVGSTGTNAGTVATEVNASTKVWNVIINGVAQKILLA